MNTYKICNKISSRLVSLLIIFLIASILNSGCQKFLDVKRNSTVSLIESASDCQLLLNDYADMNIVSPSDGEASADDYYLNNTGYLSGSIDNEGRSLYIWATDAIRQTAKPQWQSPYLTIYNSNLVLETVDKLKGSNDQILLNDLRGQALFFRAYTFWQLAQLYANPYNTVSSGQSLGIPLRLTSDINEKSVRGTVQETYDRITNDLKESVAILNTSSTVASRPNKCAAYAMLARVYLSMEDYTQALTNANQALALNNQLIDYNTISKSSETPFSRFNKEVIFHSLMTADGSLQPNSSSDNIAKINIDLVNSYNTNDLRSKIFLKINADSSTYRFSGNYEPSNASNFFNGLAVDELLLIRAECYARAGNTAAALTDLNTLLITRCTSGNYLNVTATNTDDALAKILTERRKELLMRGLRWTDLRRLNHDTRFAKTLTRIVSDITYTLPPNDLRYTLLIPTEVIQNAKIEQNPR